MAIFFMNNCNKRESKNDLKRKSDRRNKERKYSV